MLQIGYNAPMSTASAPTQNALKTDRATDLEELKTLVQQFCEDRDWDQFHDPKELAIGLSTEAAELLEHFRFQSPEQIRQKLHNPNSREAISDELADTLFFILRFAQMENIDLSKALHQKLEKSAKKYPVESSKGKNVKYTELQQI